MAQSAVDLVLPPRCLVCGAPGRRETDNICLRCHRVLEEERAQPACPRCAGDVAEFEVSDDRCRQCRRQSPSVNGTVRAGAYRDVLGRILRAYKFRHQDHFEPLLARWMVSAGTRAPWWLSVEAVVAVPAFWRRRLGQAYYPASRLACTVAAHLKLPLVPLLRRLRGGPHQVGLSHTKRWENVKGAFAARTGYKLDGPNLLLVDDVRTTGATLAECAKVLRRAGARRVYAAVVVSAGDPQRKP